MFKTCNRMFRFYYFWSAMSIYNDMLILCGLFQFVCCGYSNKMIPMLIVPCCLMILSKISLHKLLNIFDDIQHSKNNHVEIEVKIENDRKDRTNLVYYLLGTLVVFFISMMFIVYHHVVFSIVIPYIVLFLLYVVYACSDNVFPNSQLIEKGYYLTKCKVVNVLGEYPDDEMQAIKKEQYYIFHTKRNQIQKAIILGDKNRAFESHFCLAEKEE